MAKIKVTLTIEANLMRDVHLAIDAADARLRAAGGRVISGKLKLDRCAPPQTAATVIDAPSDYAAKGEQAMQTWCVIYTRIPTNYNNQKLMLVEAASAADARELARDHLGDRGKAFATYHIEDVKPHAPVAAAGRVLGGGQ